MTNLETKKEIKAMYKKHLVGNEPIQGWWDYLATKPKDLISEVVSEMGDVEKRLKDFKDGYYFTTKIRGFVNYCGWTDVTPYEVVEVISDITVKIRAMETKQIRFPQQVHVGGFSAHTADNYGGQEYEYISNESNPIETIRKGKQGWGLGKYKMSDNPYKFYDYNF